MTAPLLLQKSQQLGAEKIVMTAGNFYAPDHLYILYPSACASCALITDSILFFQKKLLVIQDPKKQEHPLTSLTLTSPSHCPVLLSTGSAHIRSQNNPVLGIYLNLSIFFMSSSQDRIKNTDLSYGEIPPCTHRNFLLMRHARGI